MSRDVRYLLGVLRACWGTGNIQSIEHLKGILLPESFLLVMLEEEDVMTLG